MSEEGVFYAKDSDEVMNLAMDKALITIGYFEESLTQPKPDQYSFSAKVGLKEGSTVEHIWLGDVVMEEDRTLYGTISNHPVNLKNVSMGSKVLVERKDISDWMIIEAGRLIGGYTLRAYREGLEMAAREDFDQSLGIVIDYGVDYYPHDFTTPEGAILCLEDAYTNNDIDAAANCKNFLRESGHLLARIPEMAITGDIISSTAETLEVAYRAHFEENPMPNFDGILRAFPEKDFEDDDTVMVTEICYLPDGEMTMDKIWVYRVEGAWKVGPPANEDA